MKVLGTLHPYKQLVLSPFLKSRESCNMIYCPMTDGDMDLEDMGWRPGSLTY